MPQTIIAEIRPGHDKSAWEQTDDNDDKEAGYA
jgi:hypothetical protein